MPVSTCNATVVPLTTCVAMIGVGQGVAVRVGVPTIGVGDSVTVGWGVRVSVGGAAVRVGIVVAVNVTITLSAAVSIVGVAISCAWPAHADSAVISPMAQTILIGRMLPNVNIMPSLLTLWGLRYLTAPTCCMCARASCV